MVDEQMVVPAIEEVGEPVAEADEEQVIAPTMDMEDGHMDVSMIDMKEDLPMLFGEDDDFEDDDSKAGQPPSVYEVGVPSTAVVEGPSFPHLALGISIPPFVIEDLSTRLGNLKYGHGQLV
nr:hypothetical protein [Tanacetum cinerariifolium]